MVLQQFIWGTILLLACGMIHILMLVGWTRALGPVYHTIDGMKLQSRAMIMICLTFLALMISHGLQVWLWAYVLYLRGALPGMDECVYYSLTSYTTVGYGDVVVDQNHRITGSMASVAGMLNFGLSTAYLVALFQHVLANNVTFRKQVAPWEEIYDEKE